MASAWDVPSVGWVIIVMGWFLSPIIGTLLPKILSRLGFDATKKLWELEIHILPELENTLRAVDQERMMQRGDKVKSNVAVLDKMAARLRHAREDAEDIFDDAQHKIVAGDIFYGPVKTCIARFNNNCLWIARIVRDGIAWLVQLTRRSSLSRWFLQRRSGAPVPVTIDITASDEPVPVTIDIPASDGEAVSMAATSTAEASDKHVPIATPSNSASEEPVLVPASDFCGSSSDSSCSCSDSEEPAVPEAAPSGSRGRCLSCLCSSFCSFVDAFEAACFYRNWSYEVVGITSYKENDGVLDSLLTAISRRNLKKRIEKVESTISEVKKSPLLGVASKSAPEDIANKNRSKIRTASNRKVFGREALRHSIIAKLSEIPRGDALSSSTSPCYSVIGIYGVTGSGKTTFAKYIRDYIKEECMVEGLFHTVMCIHVSETFSVHDIFCEMLKDITKDGHLNISDREELENKLKDSLRGKRFFLILDDLWVKTKHDPQLEELISPLSVGLKGSKILVTARTKVAAGALCADEPMEMPGLDEDQYLSMFMHYALGDTSVADKEFIRVGRVIAEKLHRSPIAAVIVAGRLGANRDISFWKNTAELDMLNDTMDALWWSFQQLSPDIRRCFGYCSIFPRRFLMEKGDLVHLWIAQGFVKTSCAREDMEDIAEGYIQELASCSFLQLEKRYDNVDTFIIHDLLHDLADMVTGNDCSRIENESNQRGGAEANIPQDIRHLFIQNYDAELITEKILRLVNLRTLIIYVVEEDTPVEEKIIESICKRLQKLRVLAIASWDYRAIKEPKKFSFPESISQLKHLRYLALRTSDSSKVTFPSALTKLRHIQLLDFGHGKILEYSVGNLINLRHIMCSYRVECPNNIARLISLQTIPKFRVRNKQGCELKQLRDLNKLRGELEISGLENVKSKEETLEANLAAKERLIDLHLSWADGNTWCSSPEVEAEVLEGLCPPVGILNMWIWSYRGSRYPDWMVGKQSGGPKDLQKLTLCDWSQLGPAPQLVEAFIHLRDLRFWRCSWDALPGNMEHLTSLKRLDIHECHMIRSLPKLPLSLEEFRLVHCDDKLMKSCQKVGDPNWQKIEHIPAKNFRTWRRT